MQELEDPVVRVKAMEDNFPLFFAYHFWREFKEFHVDWMLSLQDPTRNTMITGFRASRKTTLVRWYVVRLICYKKEPNIIRQSYEDTLSWESVREIAKMLCSKTIVDDYWYLFPFESKKEDITKRSFSNFETTNWVKVASKSLWQTLRGSNTYDMKSEMSARPTVLILDDIDIVKSVTNVDIINQNEAKILWETIPALDPLRRKIVFLWNVIAEDGIVPRFYDRYENEENWDVFWQPLMEEDGTNHRPEVFTEEVVKTLKSDGKTSFNQNYMLIPSSIGSWVFRRDYFDYFRMSDFELSDGILKKQDCTIWIAIDPAFSTDRKSDDAVVILWAKHNISKWYYILDWYAATSAPSTTLSNLVTIYNKAVANGWKVSYISVEDVEINREQSEFIKNLRAKMVECEINVPLRTYSPRVKKEVRIKDTLEPKMSQKAIKFRWDMEDKSFVQKLEKQLLEFPNGDFDDTIDCLEQMVTSLDWVVIKTEPPRQRETRTLLTREKTNAAQLNKVYSSRNHR